MPTQEQEILFKKSAGTARWAYNYYLSECERVYQEYLNNGGVGNKTISTYDVLKYVNNELKPYTHTWLRDVSSNVMKKGVMDAGNAYERYFRKKAAKPCYKIKNKTKSSFYVNSETLKRTQRGFRGERLGEVKTTQSLPKLPKGVKYYNPRITHDGFHWYLSVGYKVESQEVELTGESIGVDVGITKLAVLSNGKTYSNINKTQKVKNIEKKLRREQRKLSRKLESNIMNRDNNQRPVYKKPLDECKNYQKQKLVVRKLHKQLNDIRQNYLHQTTCEIVKTKPSRIVVETLNIQGMLKNKHLAKSIRNQKLYEFKRQLKYKSELYNIVFIEVDTYYPSSKLCSSCGYKKTDLKLSERIYNCVECNLVKDRDLNASLNLSQYIE